MNSITASQCQVLIELHVPDFQKAYNFYKGFSFQLAWMEETYMVLRNGVQTLCFYGGSESVSNHSYFKKFPVSTKRGYGAEIIIFVEDVEALYASLSKECNVVAPLMLRKWGARDFRVEDPFGCYIRITEAYDLGNSAEKSETTAEVVKSKRFVL